jgi:hypothetical protein
VTRSWSTTRSTRCSALPMADDVGPEVRRRIRDILADEDLELSPTSLVQVQRVVLDTVKFLDRGDADEEPQGMTDEELEKLLGEYMPEEDD